MQKKTKNLLFFGTAIAGFIAFLVIPGSKLLQFKNQAAFSITGIKSFDVIGLNLLQLPPNWGECRFKFDLIIDNPLNESFELTVPYIRAYVGDSLLGNSIPRTETVIIKPSQRTIIPNIDFRIPTRNLQTVLGLTWNTIQGIIASRNLSLNRDIRLQIGITINGVNANVEQIVKM